MRTGSLNTELIIDLVQNTLRYSESTKELVEYLTEQFGSLFDCNRLIVHYFDNNEIKRLSNDFNEKSELSKNDELFDLSEACNELKHPQFITSNEANAEIRRALSKADLEIIIYIPLIVGTEKIGAILLFDLDNEIEINENLFALESLAGVIALTLKNALAYQNRDKELYNRTAELKIKNDEYTALNEEYKTQNENLLLAKENAEESERKLKEQSDFVNKIIECSALSTWIADKTGTAIQANSACLSFFGATEDEVIGVYNLFKDEVVASSNHSQTIKDVFEKGQIANIILDYDFNKVLHVDAKNATHKIINTILTPLLNTKGEVENVIVQAIDLTEIKQAETELIKAKEVAEENEQKFKSLFTSMQEGVYLHEIVYDTNGIATNYRIIEANPVSEKYLNIQQEVAIGKLATELYQTEQAPFLDIYAQVAETGVPHSFEVYFEPMNKHFHISVFSPRKGEFATAFLDISKTKIYESELIEAKESAEHKTSALREHQVLFETMFNTIKEGIVVTNTNREIILANSGMLTTFGYTPEELIGHQTKMFYADEEKFDQAGQKIFNKEASNTGNQYLTYYQHKDGTVFPGETFGAKLFNDQGEWIGNIGIMRNVSERLTFISDLQLAKEKAEESDKLKTEFINNMSHEIRTPMNGILGFSKLLSDENMPTERRDQYVSIIQSSGKQLLKVIDDIIEISKLGTKQVTLDEQEICLNDLMLKQFAIFDIKAKENKTPLYLKKQLSNDESIIFTDESKLNKILSNLLENALKFTFRGSIEFGYTIIHETEQPTIQIYVKDTGIGINENKQDIIFERFSQEEKELNKNVGGLGLGLSIAKENAELLGGSISLVSEKGVGSTFFVNIPYKPVFSDIMSQEAENARKLATKTVLIVEDEEINFLYMEALLEKQTQLNCKVIHAKNGQEAVEICNKNPDINFIFMDLKMPVMNGFEATQLIKKIRTDLPIVAQTAYTSKEDKQKALSAGCDDFVSKPLTEKIFEEIMKKYLILSV